MTYEITGTIANIAYNPELITRELFFEANDSTYGQYVVPSKALELLTKSMKSDDLALLEFVFYVTANSSVDNHKMSEFLVF